MEISPFTADLFGLENQIHIYYLGYYGYGSIDMRDFTKTISEIMNSVIPDWLKANTSYINFILETRYNGNKNGQIVYNLPIDVDELYSSLPLMENNSNRYQLRMLQVGRRDKDYYFYWREDFGLYRTT